MHRHCIVVKPTPSSDAEQVPKHLFASGCKPLLLRSNSNASQQTWLLLCDAVPESIAGANCRASMAVRPTLEVPALHLHRALQAPTLATCPTKVASPLIEMVLNSRKIFVQLFEPSQDGLPAVDLWSLRVDSCKWEGGEANILGTLQPDQNAVSLTGQPNVLG